MPNGTTPHRPTTAFSLKSRFRRESYESPGVAQLAVLETALWPLDPQAVVEDNRHVSMYRFEPVPNDNDQSSRQTAHVEVRAGIKPHANDEFILWGLLALTLDHQEPQSQISFTPHWLLKQLGLPTGGKHYGILRDALDRLASLIYHCDKFYDPISQKHDFVTFSFFSLRTPYSIKSKRLWTVNWNDDFFKMCLATGGSVIFDLNLFRKYDPATRRLFLKLKDRFHRSAEAYFNLDDLTICGLGFSADRPAYKRKHDLSRCLTRLVADNVVRTPRSGDSRHFFIKRGVGKYTVRVTRGTYFDQMPKSAKARSTTSESPLYTALSDLGVDDSGIRYLLTNHSEGRIQQWVNVAQMALEKKPRAFPGFKVSPAAFVVDGVKNNRMPPDWFAEEIKREERQRYEQLNQKLSAQERATRKEYEQAKHSASKEFVSANGKQRYEQLVSMYQPLFERDYGHAGRARQFAEETALDRIADNELGFPSYETWVVARSK